MDWQGGCFVANSNKNALYRHSRAGGNPDRRITTLSYQCLKTQTLNSCLRGRVFHFNRLYKSDFQMASPLFRIIRKRIRPKDWYERQQIKHEHGGGQNRGDGDEEYRVHVH